MQNKILAGVIVLILILVGIYYFFFRASHEELGTAVSQEQPQPTGKKIPFSELVKQGGTYKCEVKPFMSDFENTGTVYLDGTNIRGDFSTVAEGKTVNNFFILKDGYAYNWSSISPAGDKIKIDSKKPSETYSWSPEQVGDYDCQPWTSESVKFNLPLNVNFYEVKTQ